ncbi:MAG: rRNA maturation RNAse YbeY, partial [Ignavibacteria bacterium]|nr:rRNA maturation RNAse YbeY [Ignavibacteria bacterium]
MKNLQVFDSQNIINKKNIHLLIKELSRELCFKLTSLEINFISGDEIHHLNKTHLKHDYRTDIITFS